MISNSSILRSAPMRNGASMIKPFTNGQARRRVQLPLVEPVATVDHRKQRLLTRRRSQDDRPRAAKRSSSLSASCSGEKMLHLRAAGELDRQVEFRQRAGRMAATMLHSRPSA